ncbi:MAG: CHAT domain-containing protein [Thermoanaerobaculia bacterium]|nr:CHAT domain-containing protein [Thermoanaerobaculia bacterium]
MPRGQTYEDFALKIHPDGAGGYEVRLLASPYGAHDSKLALPFAQDDLATLLTELEGAVRSSAMPTACEPAELRHVRAAAGGQETRFSPRDFGAALFDALFQGSIRESYFASRGRVDTHGEMGLRLRLVFDPESAVNPLVCSLPWELLYRKDAREFPARTLLFPVVRYLEVPRPRQPAPLPEKPRLLVAIANPRDTPPLALDAECSWIERAWAADASLEIEVLRHANPESLRQALRDGAWEMFHFIGHGDFDPATGAGRLLFESEDGHSRPVPGAVLAETLSCNRALRLAFLNACDTARLARRAGVDPFTGVATALLMGGLPAVLAMQFPIADATAARFSHAFYRAIAAGDPVDAAVSEGRLAIYQAEPESWEWATPVLFMSVADGRIFNRAQAQDRENAEAIETPHPEPDSSHSVTFHNQIEASKGVVIGKDVHVGDFNFS